MAVKLKTFSTSNGLTESLIAASSKAEALAAWGATRDLFREGLARETDDPAAVALAAARPGEVVSRSVLDAGALEAALAAMPKAKKDKAAAKPDKKRRPSREALERVAKLEAKLAEHDRRHREALDAIARRRAELDEEERRLRGAYAARRRELDGKLQAARERLDAER